MSQGKLKGGVLEVAGEGLGWICIRGLETMAEVGIYSSRKATPPYSRQALQL